MGKQSGRMMQASRSSCFDTRVNGRNSMLPERRYKSNCACALRVVEVVHMRREVVYILLGVYVAGSMELHVGLTKAIKDLAEGCLNK